MHIKKDDLPLVAYPKEELWVEFRDQPVDSVVWVSSITDTCDIVVESGATQDPDLLAAVTTINLTYRNARRLVDLVTAGVPLTHRFVRFRPTSGRFEASVAGPMEFRHYLRVLIA
ncbi:MAG: hypothetical protein AB7L09_00260 [Nitrospira sp.]